ncbi:ATP-binding protein [Tundrisphaera sp. TA3]|uniref:HAMP domain-containing sensor histidine kinase n=1 Tax=Tundrisphaera sp. TA3 TaxID=3435775 RepID=UPI003EBB67BC
MFTKLRSKLFLGLAPLLILTIGLGLWAVAMLDHLGGRIDVILRENYESVLAAEGMKEALERMDSAALISINGPDAEAREQYRANAALFDRNLVKERANITEEGEKPLADRIADRYARYQALMGEFFALPRDEAGGRWAFYSGRLLPLFAEIKAGADEVLRVNQAKMKEEDRRAREAARQSRGIMVAALVGATAIASAIALLLGRSLLGPILAVTRSARALGKGDYDQVVPVTSHDELGELAATFNGMARTLREYRRAGTEELVRAQQTAQATIDSFPDPVVVVDPDGAIERANPAARRILGVSATHGPAPWTPPGPLRSHLADVLGGLDDYMPAGVEQALCLRDDGQERFFLPRVLGIKGEGDPLGAAVVLHDVTKFRLVDQLKSDMVSTVSHELKTPLTSIQMAVHLLLEEAVGPLEPKQVELLMAARQDSDRLLAMLNDLLDLTRIEQGRVRLDLKPVAPGDLAAGAIERFESRARDAGIGLAGDIARTLPRALVDRERIEHVFDNLIGNALAHTRRGGSVRLTAEADGGFVRISVADDGEGIPGEHLPRIFDRFYRVPGARSGGAGLGLAIAREIVAAHGGQIEARSQPGRGTTFTFRLPIAPEPGGSARATGAMS